MAELNGIGSENQGFMNSHQVEYQQVDPELVDSDDEVAVNAFPHNAVSRRKLRMVIDPEDDDWGGSMIKVQVYSFILDHLLD